MIPIPNFLYRLLSSIPFAGPALMRRADSIKYTDSVVQVPLLSFADFAMRLCLSLLVVLVIVFSFYFTSSNSTRSSEKPVTPSHSASKTGNESFDRFIGKGNPESLKAAYLKHMGNETDPIAMRTENIEKRISIADRLIEVSKSGADKEEAIGKKLIAEMDMILLCLENKISVDGIAAELESSLAKLESSPTNRVQDLINMSQWVLAVARRLNPETEAIETNSHQQAIELLNNMRLVRSPVATRFNNRLFGLLESRGDRELTNRLAEKINEDYTAYELGGNLLNRVKGYLERAEYELEDVLNAVESKLDDSADKLNQQISAVLQNEDVSVNLANRMANRIEDLAAVGKTQIAASLIHAIQEKPGKSLDEIRIRVAELENRIAAMEREFSLNGIVDKRNNPAKFQVKDALFRVVLFVAEESHTESVQRCLEILEKLKPSIFRRSVEFAVIYLYSGENTQVTQQMRQFAEGNKPFQVWFLSRITEAGSQLLEDFPVANTPYLVVLSNDNHLVGLNPELNRLALQIESLEMKKIKSLANESN